MLTAKEAYEKHLPAFSAIPAEEIKTPKMARSDVIGEAEELKLVAGEDREALIRAGCPAEMIESLDERTGAYTHASSVWENSEFMKSDARRQWLEEEPDAYEFKEFLQHTFARALRDNTDELKYLAKIIAGHGKRDLVIDLKDLATLGKRNMDALVAVGFDPVDLDKAEALHDRLSDLLSEANMSPAELIELKTLTYQAYTYLQEAVTEIREAGQYVFWKIPNRLELYKSEHYMTIGKLRTGEEVSVQEEEEPSQETETAPQQTTQTAT